jgi:hypothetical protein
MSERPNGKVCDPQKDTMVILDIEERELLLQGRIGGFCSTVKNVIEDGHLLVINVPMMVAGRVHRELDWVVNSIGYREHSLWRAMVVIKGSSVLK